MLDHETVSSLQSYATVIAGLGAGLDLTRALAHAGVSAADWDQLAEAWQTQIADSAASDLSVLVAFDAALIAAKEPFEPTFEPIGSDPAAWAYFRRHFVTAPEPMSFLAQHALSLAAYTRIEAAWANRLLSDETLARSFQSHMTAPLLPCPTVTRVPSRLLADREADVDSRSPAPPHAALDDASGAPDAPFSAAKPARVAPDLLREASLESAAIEPGTASLPGVERANALPFQPTPAGAALRPIEADPPIPIERYAVMLADWRVFGMTEAELCDKHGTTPPQRAQAFEYWHARVAADPTLHERVELTIRRYQVARAKAVEPDVAAKAAPPTATAQPRSAAPAKARASLNSTVAPSSGVVSPLLPFVTRPTPLPAPGAEGRVASDVTDAAAAAEAFAAIKNAGAPQVSPPAQRAAQALSTASSLAAATPAKSAPESAVPFNELTLEQFATLTVDLSLDPDRTVETLHRYGMTSAQRPMVEAVWAARLANNPAERAAFDAAASVYRAWRAKHPRQQG